MLWTVVGSVAIASSPAFAVPHLDNRMIIIRSGQTTEEVLGDQTNYTDQLAALASSLQNGMPFRNRLHDSVANAELIDCDRRTRHDVDTRSRPLVSRGLADTQYISWVLKVPWVYGSPSSPILTATAGPSRNSNADRCHPNRCA